MAHTCNTEIVELGAHFKAPCKTSEHLAVKSFTIWSRVSLSSDNTSTKSVFGIRISADTNLFCYQTNIIEKFFKIFNK